MKKVNIRSNKDDRGFSLIELIVSILIMSVIAAMVVLLISSSRATYTVVKTDAELQGEVETVRKFIGELALEARSWGKIEDYEYDGKHYKLFWIKALDNDHEGVEPGHYEYSYTETDEEGHEVTKTMTRYYYYYVFLWRPETGQLAYGKYTYDSLVGTGGSLFGAGSPFPASGELYGNDIISDQYSVLAHYVTGIDCSTSSDDTQKELLTVNLTLNYNDQEYSATMNFAGRNKVSTGD